MTQATQPNIYIDGNGDEQIIVPVHGGVGETHLYLGKRPVVESDSDIQQKIEKNKISFRNNALGAAGVLAGTVALGPALPALVAGAGIVASVALAFNAMKSHINMDEAQIDANAVKEWRQRRQNTIDNASELAQDSVDLSTRNMRAASP